MENKTKKETETQTPSLEQKGKKVADVQVECVEIMNYGKSKFYWSAKLPNGNTATSKEPLEYDELNMVKKSGQKVFKGEMFDGVTENVENKKGEIYDNKWLRVDVDVNGFSLKFFLSGKSKGIARYALGLGK